VCKIEHIDDVCLTLCALLVLQFRAIAIIAEGIPENKTKLLIRRAREKSVAIIGPALYYEKHQQTLDTRCYIVRQCSWIKFLHSVHSV